MVLSDCPAVREEAIKYAIGLAGRLDAFVVLLFVLSRDEGASSPEARAEYETAGQSAKAFHERIERAGLSVESEIRLGEPASEFLKFLAGVGMFQAIVWGGGEEVIGRSGRPARSHWLEKVRGLLECPVVAPSKKRE